MMNYHEVCLETLPSPVALPYKDPLISYPQQAALQALEKMKVAHELGAKQILIPPLPQPALSIISALNYSGSWKNKLKKAIQDLPSLIHDMISPVLPSMWGVFTSSCDSSDQRLHITPSHLAANHGKLFESTCLSVIFSHIFAKIPYCKIHKPILSISAFHDEGSYMRLNGCFLFVYGREYASPTLPLETLQSQEAIIRTHRPKEYLFAQLSPEALAAGATHINHVALKNNHTFFCHEHAFVNQNDIVEKIATKMNVVQIANQELPIEKSQSLFSSQFVGNTLICSHSNPLLPNARVVSLDETGYIGPANSRFTCWLKNEEMHCLPKICQFSDSLFCELKDSINMLYPEVFEIEYLLDNDFLRRFLRASHALAILLGQEQMFVQLIKKAKLNSFLI